jgi:hypothetical protein
VNSLAYCKMSLLRSEEGTALIAVPSLTKDDLVRLDDVLHVKNFDLTYPCIISRSMCSISRLLKEFIDRLASIASRSTIKRVIFH